jgi:NADPH2:quinone reductase
MTAWVMLHEMASIRPGMRIAVTAAGSAIGQMIICLANANGVAPMAFVRSKRAEDNVAHLSAEVIRYDDHAGFADIAGRAQPPQMVDVIFDCVGGADAISLARLLRPRGKFVHYGLLSGQPIPPQFWSSRPDIDFSMFHLRNWIREAPLDNVHRIYAQVASLIANGIIHTKIRSSYQLQNITAALLDARHASAEGKVLITN